MEYILAPLEGFTDYKYRQAYTSVFGSLKKAVAPFVTLVAGSRVKKNHLIDLWPENNTGMEVEPQILGNEEACYRIMADALSAMGYKSLNWNLGCPVRSIAEKERGSGLLMNPQRINSFLSNAFSVSDIGLSVKIRLGYKNKDEFWEVIDVLNRYPLKYVAVHPRTGLQGYGGSVDWDFLEKAISFIKAPCVYSGDIFKLEDAKKLDLRFPSIKTCMLGRGVFYDPSLPDLLLGQDFSDEEKHEKCLRLMDAIYCNGRNIGLNDTVLLHRQKQYWVKLNIKEMKYVSDEWMGKLKRVNTVPEYEYLIKLIWKN